MSTNFPASLDTLANPAATDGLTGHASQHANANDAIEALQAKVGVDGSAVASSIDYRVSAIESGKGAANGYAPLGADSKVAAAYLPSYVDDVVEVATYAALPASGETGKIYVVIADETHSGATTQYRWSGTAYAIITSSPGSTDAVPEGTTNLYFTAQRVRDAVLTGLSTATNAVISATDTVFGALGKLQKQISDNLTTLTSHNGNTSNPHSVTKAQVGLNNVDNVADVDKPISTATQTALNAKANLISPTFTTPSLGVATGTSFNSITGLSSTTPVMDGTAAVGTGVTVARADHVHPTDTTRAPLNSPTFTGTVSAPSNFNATGAALNLQTGGTNRVTIDGNGNVFSVSPNGGLGYGPGAGGTVTQATSKSTWVALNKPCGQITMHNASLEAGALVNFACMNSILSPADVIVASIDQSSITAYSYRLEAWNDGTRIRFLLTNPTGLAVADAVKINFAIIKGATS